MRAAHFNAIVDQQTAFVEKQVTDAAKAGSSSGASSSGASRSYIDHPSWSDYKSYSAFHATHTKGWNVARTFGTHVVPAFDNDPSLWTKHKVLGQNPAAVIEEMIEAYEDKNTNNHTGPNGDDWKAGFKTNLELLSIGS